MTLTAQGVGWGVRGKVILDGVGLVAAPGETVGLLGPNGSGKSSLLRLLAGLRRPDAGAIALDGAALAGLGRRRVAGRVAVVEQESVTDQDPPVRDVIDLGRTPHRRPWMPRTATDAAAVERAAAVTDVGHLLDQHYRTLSGGERQRVQLARALAQDPDLLLLDEPTNHLDLRHQLDLLALVRRTPVTTVMALHDLNLAAAHCDRLVVLADGRTVAAGPPAEVLTAELVAEVYGVRARIERDQDGIYVRYLAHVDIGAKVDPTDR